MDSGTRVAQQANPTGSRLGSGGGSAMSTKFYFASLGLMLALDSVGSFSGVRKAWHCLDCPPIAGNDQPRRVTTDAEAQK